MRRNSKLSYRLKVNIYILHPFWLGYFTTSRDRYIYIFQKLEILIMNVYLSETSLVLLYLFLPFSEYQSQLQIFNRCFKFFHKFFFILWSLQILLDQGWQSITHPGIPKPGNSQARFSRAGQYSQKWVIVGITGQYDFFKLILTQNSKDLL